MLTVTQKKISHYIKTNKYQVYSSALTGGSCGLMVRELTHNPKVAGSSLGSVGIVGGGSECTALSPPSIPRLKQGTEPPTVPRPPQHKWLPTAPGVCSRCVCVFTAVCAHLGWVKCRA